MLSYMISSFHLSRLFVLEQVREPLGIFWSLLVPPLLFTFFNLEVLGTEVVSNEWYLKNSGWFLSYMALSISMFGFCMYMIGRRESGFIK